MIPMIPEPFRPRVDRDSAPWWAYLREGEFRLQRCAACTAWRWFPRAMCGRCGSFDAEWLPVTGTGTIVAWSITHHQFAAWAPVPNTTVTVRLDEQDDVLFLAAFDGGEPPAVGQRVAASIVALEGDTDPDAGLIGNIVVWRPIEAPASAAEGSS